MTKGGTKDILDRLNTQPDVQLDFDFTNDNLNDHGCFLFEDPMGVSLWICGVEVSRIPPARMEYMLMFRKIAWRTIEVVVAEFL